MDAHVRIIKEKREVIFLLFFFVPFLLKYK